MAQRFEGRNLEEALDHASSALGVERYQLAYHVVLEKRGFMGGIKRLVIEAEVSDNPTPAQPVIAPSVSPLASLPPRRDARPPRQGGGHRDRDGGRDRGRGGDRDRRGGGRDDRGRGGMRAERSPRFEEVPAQGEQSADAKILRDWCDELADLADFDLQARTEETDQAILVRLYGGDTHLLVSRDGELLDSIQVIANKALVGRKISKAAEFDSRSFKQKRSEEIERQAHEAAERVRHDGGEELLPAMSPVERRIVHVALQEDPDVTTESRGEGFFKRVAIIPRSAVEPSPEP